MIASSSLPAESSVNKLIVLIIENLIGIQLLTESLFTELLGKLRKFPHL